MSGAVGANGPGVLVRAKAAASMSVVQAVVVAGAFFVPFSGPDTDDLVLSVPVRDIGDVLLYGVLALAAGLLHALLFSVPAVLLTSAVTGQGRERAAVAACTVVALAAGYAAFMYLPVRWNSGLFWRWGAGLALSGVLPAAAAHLVGRRGRQGRRGMPPWGMVRWTAGLSVALFFLTVHIGPGLLRPDRGPLGSETRDYIGEWRGERGARLVLRENGEAVAENIPWVGGTGVVTGCSGRGTWTLEQPAREMGEHWWMLAVETPDCRRDMRAEYHFREEGPSLSAGIRWRHPRAANAGLSKV
ncbi:hypothetical protein [Streptomyces sp. NPDC090445]|uniref:hypothetical protein n=1 Tax=Streptomyces sp. NPDC090445 TaxID=3365963 RepID=UPI0038092938